MFGLFGFVGEKIVGGICDSLCDVVDTLDKGFDVFANTFDMMIDKAGDIRYNVEDFLIDTEYHAKEFINSASYIAKTRDYEEFDYMKYNINEYGKSIVKTTKVITDDVAEIIKGYNTLKDRVLFTASFFNISDEEAEELIREYGLNQIRYNGGRR